MFNRKSFLMALCFMLISTSAFSWSAKKRKFNVTTYQNVYTESGFGLIHTFTCFKKGYSQSYYNGRYVYSKENKMKDGDCRSVSTHGYLFSTDGLDKAGWRKKGVPTVHGDGNKDFPLRRSYARKRSRSRSKYMCRMNRVLGQEKNHYTNPCFFIYGLHGVCHNFSARLHKAGSIGSFDFSQVGVKSVTKTRSRSRNYRWYRGERIAIYTTKTKVNKLITGNTKDVFDGGRLSRYVYGKYGARPTLSHVKNVARGINNVEKILGTKQSSKFKRYGIGLFSAITSLYHNMTMCKIYYYLRCGV